MKNKERIYIENFAGISKLDLEINDINILIGPQGVGKSVVVKLLYFFKDTFNEIQRHARWYLDTTSGYFEFSLRNRFTSIFADSVWHENNPFEVRYINKQGLKFVISGSGKSDFIISYPNEIKVLIEELSAIRKNFGDLNIDINNVQEYLSKNNDFNRVAREIITTNYGDLTPQVFIPAGRSFFSAIHENIYSILSGHENNVTLDPFLLDFGSLYQRSKSLSTKLNEGFDNSCKTIIEDVLGGEFLVDENDKEYIVHKDSRKVELKHTSSGQQEALPLILILKGILNKQMYTGGCVLYIEEPEAHLFPTAQKLIVDLLAKVYNSNPGNIQIFITTHSPYILTSFNNLIYAGNISKSNGIKRDKVLKLVPEDQLLSYNIVNANAITRKENYNLMKEEGGIIDATLLDKVSNTIGEAFDQLLDIEFEEDGM